MKQISLFLVALSALGWQQQPHLIPPAGVPVSDADQRQVRAGLSRLATRMEAYKTNPHIADVKIFHKAVQYALEGNEFFTAEDVFRARNCSGSGTIA